MATSQSLLAASGQAHYLSMAAERMEAAALVLTIPGWWTREVFARRQDNQDVWPDDPRAVKFCARGAYHAAGGCIDDFGERALDAYSRRLYGVEFATFNNEIADNGRVVASAMLDVADLLRAKATGAPQ